MSAVARYRLEGFHAGLDWRLLTFDKALPAIRVCGLCGIVPRATVILPCSHVLCETCFKATTVNRDHTCPFDDRTYDEEAVGKLRIPVDQVLQLNVLCWNQGCGFVGSVSRLLEHFEKDCAFHSVNCNRCGHDVQRLVLVQHYAECGRAFSGQNPGARGGRTALMCSDILKASAEFKHSFTELRNGYCKLQTNLNALSGDVKRSQSETTAALVNVSSLLQSELTTLRTQLEALQSQGNANVAAAPTTDIVCRGPIELNEGLYIIGSGDALRPLLENNGIQSDNPKCARRALWTVSNLASLCAQASRYGQTLTCSDVFTLDGYMARLEISLLCVDCILFMRPCFRLCRGANDAGLEWPFKKAFSVKLAHVQRQGVSVRFEVDTAHMDARQEFWMPKRERNAPFAMCEMTLHTTGFSSDGTGTLEVYLEL